MLTLDQIPQYERPPAGAATPRWVEVTQTPTERRSFLRVVAFGGMTLGVTLLNWLPPARATRAWATVGTEWLNCSIFSYSDSILCSPYPYSSSYCGTDKWFKNGWFNGDKYVPLRICNTRNAWRWQKAINSTTVYEYRCADGDIYWNGTGSPSRRICSPYLRAIR